ncbi:hypothetical protein EV127DRAFT_404297 [Xylaria flabelliformis]|nr:hypothetical protein EV127DRAFT_404297 [Xylaria flabelliformis]
MQFSISSILTLLCLAPFFGLNVVSAWSATFFSEEMACGQATANATSLEYQGPDLDDTLIPQLMACLDLGSEIGDPLVNCTAHMTQSDEGPTGTGDCDVHAGFVGKSVTVNNMLFCLGVEVLILIVTFSGSNLVAQVKLTIPGPLTMTSRQTAVTQASGSAVSNAFSNQSG